MAEGSHGKDTRLSQSAFRAHDRVHSNRASLEQATRLSTHKGPSMLRRLRNIALAAGIVTGAGTGVAHVIDEVNKPPAESYQSYHSLLKQIDTSKYLVEIHKEGEKDLVIRHDPFIPDFDDRQRGKDNYIKMNDIVSINGTAWDGKSPVVIENTPIAMATDPTTGILESPWLAVTLGHKSTLGDITETVGFISHSSATDAHITRLDDEGGITRAQFENGQLTGKNEYGDTVIPADKVGLASIAGHSVTTQVGNPQS